MSSCSNCGTRIEAPVRFCPNCGTRVVEAEIAEGLIGKTLADKYRLLSELGAGSMGTVYLAEHLGLRKKVAIKILHPDLLVSEETLRRFQREGIAAGSFSHPNAIQIFDFDRSDGMYFLAMEYVEGLTLSQYIREHGALEPQVAISILQQVLGALVEAHGNGIVHRDLKPDNIMVLEGVAGALTVKVLDFGLSKLVDRPQGASLVTQVGQIMGTPLYMAPEQAGGDNVDHRSDLYAVGLILYESLTGQPPFEGGSITELLIKQATESPPSIFDRNPSLGVPQAVEEIIRKALEKLRENRYQSASEMMAALSHLDLTGPPGKATPAPPVRGVPSPPPGEVESTTVRAPGGGGARRAFLVAAVLLVSALGLLAAFYLGGEGGTAYARVRLKEAESRSQVESAYLGDLDDARSMIVQGRFDAALAMVDRAKQRPCADAEASYVGGLIALASGDRDLAVLELSYAVEQDPDYPEPAVELAWIRFEAGELDEARILFERGGEMGAALAGRGALALEAGDVGGAVELLERATTIDSGDARSYRWLGRAHVQDSDLESAREALLVAKKNGAVTWETLADLGQVYLGLDRLEDAERELTRAAELDPRAVGGLADLGAALLDAGRAADAIELLAGPVAANPRAARVAVAYATALEKTGRRDDAFGALERGLASTSDAVPAEAGALGRGHLMLGILRQESGQEEAAADSYRAAIALDEGLALSHLNLGLLHFREERFESARDELERAVELEDTLTFAHYALGILYMDYLGDAARAGDHLERYLELGGDDVRVRDWLGRLGRR